MIFTIANFLKLINYLQINGFSLLNRNKKKTILEKGKCQEGGEGESEVSPDSEGLSQSVATEEGESLRKPLRLRKISVWHWQDRRRAGRSAD